MTIHAPGPLPPIATEPLPDGNVRAFVAGTHIEAVGLGEATARHLAGLRLRAWLETADGVAWMEKQE